MPGLIVTTPPRQDGLEFLQVVGRFGERGDARDLGYTRGADDGRVMDLQNRGLERRRQDHVGEPPAAHRVRFGEGEHVGDVLAELGHA